MSNEETIVILTPNYINMKKIILLLGGILIGNLVNSQVILNIESPTNLAGTYTATYATADNGWSGPDMLDPANALTGVLAIVDDGTADGNMGCNPLVNGADIAGKIAVVYRGTCQFGTKALNAQNAGAIAVIIINNVPGDPLGMLGGDDGGSVTIPVFMISQIDGQVITNTVNTGTDVTVFLGNKNGLFETDLGVKNYRLLLPVPNATTALLAQNATDYSFRIGAWVYNYGNLAQTGASIRAEVNFGDNIIYSETINNLDIVSGDSIYVELPVFSRSSYQMGDYKLKYTITTAQTDEYEADNLYEVPFKIGGDVFSYVKLNADGLPESTTGYRSTTATTTFSACVVFRHPNASRVKAEGLYFAASTNADGSLEGQDLTLTAYEINDVFGDLNDLDFNTAGVGLQNIAEAATGSYIYDTDTLEFTTVYGAFDTPFTLINNKRYMFCVSTYDVNTYIGFGDLDYSWTIDTVLQPMFPIQSNTAWNIVGFGGESAAIGVKMVDVTADVASNSASNFVVYPNPSNSIFNIKGIDLSSYNTIEVKDQLGRIVKTWKVNSTEFQFETKSFEPGNYFLQLTGNNGSIVEKIQILK